MTCKYIHDQAWENFHMKCQSKIENTSQTLLANLILKMKVLFGFMSMIFSNSLPDALLPEPRGDCSGCKCVAALHTSTYMDCKEIWMLSKQF